MRTTNNLFRKVHNHTHWKWWFTQFERKSDVLEIFHYFQYFESFRSKKKWQISKPKIVHWCQVKERHLFFQNLFFKTMGNLPGPLYMSPVDWAGRRLPGWFIWEISARFPRWEKAKDPGNEFWRQIWETKQTCAYHSFDKIFSPLTEISVEKTEISGTEPARPLK